MESVCEELGKIGGEGGQKHLLTLKERLSSEEELGVLAKAIVVAAGHSGSHYWTDTENRKLAHDVLVILCTKFGHTSCHDLLTKNALLLSAIWDHLKTILTKCSWKNHPVHKQALVWVIKSLEHPNLTPHFHNFIPPILWMLDDYSDYHRVLALSVINHILLHMNHTELRWQGRAQLLYQAIQPLLYVNSSHVVSAVHPCLLKLLPVFDFSTCPNIPAKVLH